MKKGNKIKIFWHWIIFIVSLVGSGVYIWYSYLVYKTNQSEDLSRFTKIVKSAINPDRIKSLKGTDEDLKNPDYIRLKEQLSEMANSSSKVRYIYLMGYNPEISKDKLFFFVDTQPKQINGHTTEPNDLAVSGEIYLETDQKLLNAYKNGRELVINTPETDKWGTFISALEPVFYRQSSKVAALVGVDYAAENTINEVLWFVLPRFLMFSILSIGFHFFADWILHKNEEDFVHSRMMSLMKYSNDAIYSCDLEEKIVDWNLGAEKLFGYKESEIVGRPLSTLVSKEYLPQVKENIFSVKEGVSIINQKTRRLAKGDKLINVSITISPIYNSNATLIGYSIIARDIESEIKQNSKLEKDNAELEELNQLLVGRELKMIELKRKIKELEAKLK